MNTLTILTSSGHQPLTKQFIATATGLQKLPMHMSKMFRVKRRSFGSIYDLHNILCYLERDSFSFIIRGEPIDGLDLSRPMRRLKYSDTDAVATFQSSAEGNRWICFDFDKIECPAAIDPSLSPEKAIRYLRRLLPAEFQNVTCSWQWSSGAGLDGWSTLSAHLWFMLATPFTDDRLREWVYDLRLPVDASLFNAVQPHFTAAPIFHGMNDHINQRSGLISGTTDVVKIKIAEHIDRDITPVRRSPIRASVAEPIGAGPQFIGSDDQILSYWRAGGPIGLLSALKEASRRSP